MAFSYNTRSVYDARVRVSLMAESWGFWDHLAMARAQSAPTSLEKVAERLWQTREAFDSSLSQTAWCRRVGIGPQAWNNYEQGKRLIRIDKAIDLCIAIGVSLDWIYRGLMATLPGPLVDEINKLRRKGARKEKINERPRQRRRGPRQEAPSPSVGDVVAHRIALNKPEKAAAGRQRH